MQLDGSYDLRAQAATIEPAGNISFRASTCRARIWKLSVWLCACVYEVCFSSPSCNCTAQPFSPPALTALLKKHTHAYLCSRAPLQIVPSNCKRECPTLLLCEQLFISSQAKPTGGLTVYIRERVTPVVQCILWPRGDFGCIYFSSCLCGEETHI